MKIVLVSGLDRTGKSTVGELLSEFHFKKIELGNMVRNLCNEENLRLGISEYYEANKNHIEKMVMEKINVETEHIDLIYKGASLIGARSESLKKSIEEKFDTPIILFVSSTFDLRYERYLNAKNMRPLEPIKTKKDFRDNDTKQYNWGLRKYQDDANFVITNNDDLDALKEQVANFMKKVN